MTIDFSNARKRLTEENKTVGGLEIDSRWQELSKHYYLDFVDAIDSYGFTTEDQFMGLLLKVNQYDDWSKCLRNPEIEVAELAAYGLVMLDRIMRAETEGTDHAEIFEMHEQLNACRSPISIKYMATVDGLLNANRRHAETNQFKREVFQWLTDENRVFKSADSAATEIIKLVPVAHITAKRWFQKWKKGDLC
jgi:hypothetical protein